MTYKTADVIIFDKLYTWKHEEMNKQFDINAIERKANFISPREMTEPHVWLQCNDLIKADIPALINRIRELEAELAKTYILDDVRLQRDKNNDNS